MKTANVVVSGWDTNQVNPVGGVTVNVTIPKHVRSDIKFVQQPSGTACWAWFGTKTHIDGETIPAYLWTKYRGALPENTALKTECVNEWCCNPNHHTVESLVTV